MNNDDKNVKSPTRFLLEYFLSFRYGIDIEKVSSIIDDYYDCGPMAISNAIAYEKYLIDHPEEKEKTI